MTNSTMQPLGISTYCSLQVAKFSPPLLSFPTDNSCYDTMWKFHPSQQLEIIFLIVNLFNNLFAVCYNKYQIIHTDFHK